MSSISQFAEVLGPFVDRMCYTPGQLSRLTGIPKSTIVNWHKGRVEKPRHYQDVLRLADALHLNQAEATALLLAAGYPSIIELARQPDADADPLLNPWIEEVRQRAVNAPFQAIADLPYFIGREEELSSITDVLLNGEPGMICTLYGMAGVGKTALATHTAYQLKSEFPDGVLWARLDVSDPIAILGTFAGAYGRDVSRQTDLPSRSRVVRELLANKRALLVLDNAEASEQIQPLLPPSGHCAVLITTRSQNLSVTWGSRRFHIRPFTRESGYSLALFSRILGNERVRREEEDLLELADLLGHLPLALAIVASRLAYESDMNTEELLRRTRHRHEQLDLLVAEGHDVRVAFDLSYEVLNADQQRSFATLGLFSGQDFSVHAAAHTLNQPIEAALSLLRKLVSLSLLEESDGERYRMHPLLRAYALEHLDTSAPSIRFVEYFVSMVEAEARDRDYERLEQDVDNILGALEIALRDGKLDTYVRGVDVFSHYAILRGLHPQIMPHLAEAERLARLNWSTGQLVNILHSRGQIERFRGNYQVARGYLEEGLTLARQTDYRAGMVAILGELGVVADLLESYDSAEKYFREGLEISYDEVDYNGITWMLLGLGLLSLVQDDCTQAEAYLDEGIELARRVEDGERISDLLVALGMTASRQKAYGRAVHYYSKALTSSATCRSLVSTAQMGLGVALGRMGCQREAIDTFDAGLALARDAGQSWTTNYFLNEWGEVCLTWGQLAAAQDAFRESVQISRRTGVRRLCADALYGLARVALEVGDVHEARQLGEESIVHYRDCFVQTNAVEDWIARLVANRSALR